MPRDVETLTDAALDGELLALLDVAPSGDFESRVRATIAVETRTSPGWRASWPTFALAGGAVAAMVVAASVWTRPVPTAIRAVASDVTRNPPAAVTLPVMSAPVEPGDPKPAAVARKAPRSRVPGARSAAPFPEVMISETEVRAYRALITRSAPLVVSLVDGAAAGASTAADIAPLAVNALAVAPLPPTPELAEGGL